ncbi:MAG: SulP family inorganic anion transporter [Myxococcota bacterium]
MAGRRRMRDDVVAGLTVTLVGLPQCLAYALMSGLPPAYGLVTAAVPGLVAAAAGKSAQVVTGPTNTTGLLVLAALGPYLAANGLLGAEGLPVLATLTLLAGLIRLLAAYLGAAHLLRFLPESVLVGFITGAGVLIAAMHLDEALGLPSVRAGNLGEQLEALYLLFASGRWPAWPAVAVSVATAALILGGRRWLPGWPVALVAVVGATALAWGLGLDAEHGLPVVGDRAQVPRGWPAFALPTLDPGVWSSLLLPAAAITLLGTLELTVTARAGGRRPDMKREIAAQGWANVAGAFVGAFPASASLTRSALLRLDNAHSRWAPALAAVFMVPILLAAGPAVAHLPQASLAGVLLVVAYGMIQRGRLVRMWRASRETQILVAATALATITLPLEWAILLGAGLGLVLHLAQTSAPRLTLLEPRGDRLVPVEAGTEPETIVLEVSGNLHYAAVPAFVEQAQRMVPPSARLVVIDLSHAQDLRFAALDAFEQMAGDLHARGTELRLAGVGPHFRAFARRAGSRLPMSPVDPEPGASARRALGNDPELR